MDLKALRENNKLYTNVCVKIFDEELNDDTLCEMFEKYGKITSHKAMIQDDGKPRGFGFVAFENVSEAAEKAVKALNGKELNDSCT